MGDGVSKGDYIELLKLSLTGAVHQASYAVVRDRAHALADDLAAEAIDRAGLEVVQPMSVAQRRDMLEEGRGGWPLVGETMIGLRRLENIERCVEDVLERGVPGDLIETGVWRGGAAIFMRGLLKAHGIRDRRVWAADSFKGLPPPDGELYPADKGDRHHTREELAVTAREVRANFRRYGLLDEQVALVEGWFRETLPTLNDVRWAVIRLDGDMYESTILGLAHLYPRLSVGGYLIVDDYGALPACKQAVDDYRREHGITEDLAWVDWTGIYWRREKAAEPDA